MDQITGIVKAVSETKEISASFKKRELVVTTAEQYPQHILIEFVQDKTDLLNKVKVGENVTVNINLQGREWVNPQGVAKYFNSIKGWRIEVNQEGEMPPAAPMTTETSDVDLTGEDSGDLPF